MEIGLPQILFLSTALFFIGVYGFLTRRNMITMLMAVVLMLASPPGSASGRALCELFGIAARTLRRWCAWWRVGFPATPFWQSMRERFMPPVVTEQLPQALLERFDAGAIAGRWLMTLRLIAPLSTRLVIR